jgi:hypothetical protein
LRLKRLRLALAYLPVRALPFSPALLWFTAAIGLSQPVDVKNTPTPANLPMYRPALIGSGPNALINVIDTQSLIKQGQKNAGIMFSCIVAPTGDIVWSSAYRGGPESKLLEQEVLKRLASVKFIPAIRNHQPVTAEFYGTVEFAVVDGKPRLRIFANQQLEELKQAHDFIGPQPYFGADSKFDGFHYPDTGSPVAVTGNADVALTVDVEGNLKDIRLVSEYPPLLGFGEAAVLDFRKAKFIPAFRNGQPVESTVILPAFYRP